jgi:sugar phosphate permease
LAFLDRVNVSVSAPLIMQQFHYSAGQMGLLFGAMMPTYMIFTGFAGFLMDRYKPNVLIVIGIIVWSLATLGFAASAVFAAMYIARMFFGAGESLFNPYGTKIQSNWILPQERGIAASLPIVCSMLAVALGAPLCGVILKTHTWQTLFLIFSSFGIIAIILTSVFVRTTPREAKWCSKEEADKIEAAFEKERIARNDVIEEKVPILAVLKNPKTWIFTGMYFAICLTWWADMNWLPTFLVKSRGLTVAQAGWFTMGPYLVACLGLLLGGVITDKLYKGRRLPFIVQCLVISIPLVFIGVAMKSNTVMIIFFSLAILCNAIAVSQIWAGLLGVMPRNICASIGGIMNFGGALGGFLAPMAMGYIFDATQSFYWGFGSLALATGIGGLIFGIPLWRLEKKVHEKFQKLETV